MSPHPFSADCGTGVPTFARQIVLPVARLSAYTLSFSVAAITSSPTTSG